MNCPNCGTQLPDEASFCWKCGRPIAMLSPEDYEFCKLQYRNVLYTGIAYWRATVKNDQIAQSEVHTPARSKEDPRKRNSNIEVVAKLQADGWDVYTIGEDGCVTMMRRKKK